MIDIHHNLRSTKNLVIISKPGMILKEYNCWYDLKVTASDFC